MAEINDMTTTVNLALTARGRSTSTGRTNSLQSRPAGKVGTTTKAPGAGHAGAPTSTKMRPSMLAAQLRGQWPASGQHKTEIIELLNMSDYTHQTSSSVDVDKPLFEPIPSLVEFRQYNAFEPVETQLSFRNNDTVPRRMRVIAPESQFFTITGPRNVRGQPVKDSRVAPGTEVQYTVTFTPREVDAYMFDIVVVTEREKFVVPVRSQGTVGVLSWPDGLSFSSTPVKSTAMKTIVVRNTGTRGSEFALSVPPCFKVSPQRGYVDVDQNLPVTLEFTPTQAGPVSGDMMVSYADGFSAFVELTAAGHDVDVRLSASELAFPGTYTSLSNSFRVTLTNASDIPAPFVWRACVDAAGEAADRTSRLVALEAEYESERAAILDAPDDELLDVDGDGIDDLSDSDEEDRSPARLRRTRAGQQLADEGEDEGADPFHAVRALMGSGPLGGMSTISGGQGVGVAKRTNLVALKRKYSSLAHSAAVEPLDFKSEVFSISPSSGTVWSKSTAEFIVMFAPNQAVSFEALAWLDVAGRTQRLPLHLSGHAYGPKLTFSYDVVDVGDVYLTAKHRYEVVLMNKGEIDADWTIRRPKTKFGGKFQFEPASGHIRVGESSAISVYFFGDELGAFEESFKVFLRGNVDTMKLLFKGTVIGPTFAFDVANVYFGRVPFDFTLARRFTLFNTSDVAFTYSLRVPQDGLVKMGALDDAAAEEEVRVIDARTGKLKTKKRKGIAIESVTAVSEEQLHPPKFEFELTPSRATIAPGGLHNIQLDFTTSTVKPYDGYTLSVDVDGVGRDVFSLPIIAECAVAKVELVTSSVQMGEVFLRHPYPARIVLRNTDKELSARFRILPLEPQLAVVALLVPSITDGIIPPNASLEVGVTVTAYKLGVLSLPVIVHTQGSESEPLMVELMARGRGPRVLSTPSVLDFGLTPCLKDAWREIVLMNDSTINAPIQLFTRGSGERFHVDLDEAVLPPGSKAIVRVKAFLDDTSLLTDDLVVNVMESDPLVIPLKATGTGSTLAVEPDFVSQGGIDMGQLFTAMPTTRTIVMENRGQRTQTLSWVNTTQRMKDLNAKKAAKKKDGKDATASLPVIVAPPVFTVEPAMTLVKPRGSVTFTVTAVNTGAGEHSEEFELCVKAEGDMRTHTWATPYVRATFVQPLLKFSALDVAFNHDHHAGLDLPDETTGLLPLLNATKPLGLTNVSALPLDFTLRCAPPFALDAYEFTLRPAESCTVSVSFDPLYREDRVSHVLEGKITAVYREHPRRDTVKLRADCRFPNLAIDKACVNFGCVLNDTTTFEFVQVSNSSVLPVDFAWAFLEDAEAKAAAVEAVGLPYVPVNQVFDILPLRGHLEPGESAAIQFVFYGHPGRKFESIAVCEVAGGPDYEITLTGEASIASYRLDKTLIDMGQFLWDKVLDSDVYITNTGKVEYSFAVSTEATSRPGMLAVQPSTGVIPAGGKVKIRVVAKPGLPGPFREKLVFQVAHFDPVEVTVVGEAIFSVITAALPQAHSSAEAEAVWAAAVVDATAIVGKRRKGCEDGVALILQTAADTDLGATMGSTTSTRPASISLSFSSPFIRMEALARAGRLPPSTVEALAQVFSVWGYTRSEGGPIPLGAGGLSAAQEVEAEAARILFARHIVEWNDAERRVADAEAEAGMTLAHPNLTLTVPAPLRRDRAVKPKGSVGTGEGEGSVTGTFTGTASDGEGEELSNEGERHEVQHDAVAGEEKKDDTAVATTMKLPPSIVLARAAFKAFTPPSSFAALRYVVDMGHVVLGTSRKKRVTITSAGRYPVSLAYDKSSLGKNSGFVVEPGKVTRLPEGASMNIEVLYEAQPIAGSIDGLGTIEVCLPLKVSKGPAVALVLRANVTVPDLRITPEALDFGAVLRGQERILCMQLHNITPVPASWEMGLPLGAPAQIKDKDSFLFTPSRGTLHPGERCLVSVTFTPEEGRPYGIGFPVKIDMNSRARAVLCRGKGADVDLSFQVAPIPNLFAALGLTCPPMLLGNPGVGYASVPLDLPAPLSAGGLQPGATAATAGPPAPLPGRPPPLGSTSVASSGVAKKKKGPAAPAPPLVAIGPQLPAGIMGLRLVQMTNAGPTPIEVYSRDYDAQSAGEGRVLSLLEGYDASERMRMRVRAVGASLPAEAVAAACAKDPSVAVYPGSPPPVAAGAGGAEGEAPLNSPRATGRAVNVLFLGAPGVGASSSASSLAAAWGVPVITLDGVLAWARTGAGGQALADTLAMATDAAEKATAEATKAAAARAPKGKAPDPVQTVQVRVSPSTVAAALRARAGKADAQCGIVIDGAMCAELGEAAEGAAAVRTAFGSSLPGSGPLRVAHLSMPETSLSAHLAREEARLGAEMEKEGGSAGKPARVEELSAALAQVKAASDPARSGDIRTYYTALPHMLSALLQGAVTAGEVVAQGGGKEAEEGGVSPRDPDTLLELDGSAPASTLASLLLTRLPRKPEPPTPYNTDFVLPAPVNMAIVRRPTAPTGHTGKTPPETFSKFRIVRLDSLAAALAKECPPGDGSSLLPPAVLALLSSGDFDALPTDKVRWSIGAGESALFGVRFASAAEGDFTAPLSFGVVDYSKEFTLRARGVCQCPSIDSDPSSMFGRKSRARTEQAMVAHKLILSSGVFEFGPLLASRPKKDRVVPEGVHIAALDLAGTGDSAPTPRAADKKGKEKEVAATTTRSLSPTRSMRRKRDAGEIAVERYFGHVVAGHREAMRITNNGQFPASLSFILAGPDSVVPYKRGTPYVTLPEAPLDLSKLPGPPAAPGSVSAWEPANSCFVIEPAYVDCLPVGGSMDVHVWAFPPEGASHRDGAAGLVHMNSVVVHVKDNPRPVVVPISAVGAKPFLRLNGPWDPPAPPVEKKESDGKAAAAPVPAALPTKAAVVALAPDGTYLLDFERTLVAHREDRTITLTNAGLVPLVWRVNTSALNASAHAAANSASVGAVGGGAKAAPPSPRAAPPAVTGPPPAGKSVHIEPSPLLFGVSPENGTLDAGAAVTLTVSFESSLELVRLGLLPVEFADAECGFEGAKDMDIAGLAGVGAEGGDGKKPGTPAKGAKPTTAAAPEPSPSLPTGYSPLYKAGITVRAEAYKVQSGIKFDTEGGGAGPEALASGPTLTPEQLLIATAATAAGTAQYLGIDGKPIPGPDGKPQYMLLGSDGKPIMGADSKPLLALLGYDGRPAPPDVMTGKLLPMPGQVAVPKQSLGHFNFGVVRVNEAVSRSFPLANDGKYPIQYKVGLSRLDAGGADLFTFNPAEGVIEAGGAVKVEVTFCAKKEARLKQAKLLVATISDGRSGEVVDSIPVLVSAESVFSKWSLSPSAGLNFGAVKYGVDKERRIEIRNVGVFPFDFTIVPLDGAEDIRLMDYTMGRKVDAPPAGAGGAAKAAPAAGAKPGTAAAGTRPGTQAGGAKPGSAGRPAGEGPLGEFGRFLIPETKGTVPPGGIVSVPAKYVSVGAQTHHTPIRVHITGFDFVHGSPESLVYELVGESCIPGINATDWSGVFEEQVVADTLVTLASAPLLAPMNIGSSKAGRRGSPGRPGADTDLNASGDGMALNFSPNNSFVSLPGVGSADSAHSIALVSRSRSGYATLDRVFSFGSVITALHPLGVTERLRISNPTKIPVTVKFSVHNDPSAVFSVSPPVLEIPVHDAVYVDLKFNPGGVKKYSASFAAEVDGGTLAETKRMEFGLTGDGSLPTASILDPPPASRDGVEGMLVSDLGRVQVGRSRTARMTVRNDGVFPSVVKFELPFSRVFKLQHLDGGAEALSLAAAAHGPADDEAAGFLAPTAVGGKLMSVLLHPGQSASVGVLFAPDMDAAVGRLGDSSPGLGGYDESGAALFAADVRVSVLHNPYEAERIRVRAAAVLPDLAMENVTMGGGGHLERGRARHAHALGDEDTLVFPDLDLSDATGVTASFTLVNRSERPIRFQMPGGPGLRTDDPAASLAALVPAPLPELVHFAFSPQAGHLPIGGRKTVHVTFRPAAGTAGPVHLDAFALPLYYSKVTYDAGSAEPATKERAAILADASHGVGARPESASTSASKGAGKAVAKAPAPAPGKAGAPAATGKGASAKGGKHGGEAPVSHAGTVYSTRRARESPAVHEPRHEWDTSHTAVSFVTAGTPEAMVSLSSGTGEVLEGGVTVKITTHLPEPAYAVVEALPPVSAEGATPTPARPPSASGAAKAANPASGRPVSATTPTPHPHGQSVHPGIVPVWDEVGAALALNVPVHAIADTVRYELHGFEEGGSGAALATSKAISFKSTLMFQSRIATFSVRNPSAAAFAYEWSLSPTGGAASSRPVVGTGLPFDIEPAAGVVRAGESVSFTARFSPMDAADFACTAVMRAPMLSPDCPPCTLTLAGRAQRPIVHVDVPACDYLTRRDARLPGPIGEVAPLEAGIRVIEIPSLGVGVRNVRKMYVVNPTDAPYEFMLEGLGFAGTPGSAIRCITPRGLLLPGRRFELIFEFNAVNPGVTEAFFRFAIPAHALSQLLLVVGVVTEPRVNFDRSALSFKQLLLGSKGRDTVYLINEEPVPFSFAFSSSSFDGDKGSLSLQPHEGVVPAGGRLPIEVTLAPLEERRYNTNVACIVKRRTTPLHLNVKGEGYAMHDRLALEGEVGEDRGAYVASPELSATGVNFLDFGTVQVNERAARKVVISNNGSFSFDFHWAFSADGSQLGSGAAGVRGLRGMRAAAGASPAKHLSALSGAAKSVRVTPEAGRVPVGGSVTVDIEFRPTNTGALTGLGLTCTVANTKSYRISVAASGGKPSVEFSATELDFGGCFLPPLPSLPSIPVVRTLRISNTEAGRDVSLSCLWDKSAQPHLDVGLDAMVLRAGDAIQVPFTFQPRAVGGYTDTVMFEVNGVHTVPVSVLGEGVPPAIELASPAQAEVAFGAARPGQVFTRTVRLSNRSKRAAVVELIDDRITALPSPSERPGSASVGASPATVCRLACHGVSITPSRLVLKPKDTGQFELRFSSQERVAPFKEPLLMRIGAAGFGGAPLHGGMSAPIPLLSVTGACLGMDVSLEADNVMFGAVCAGSRLTKVVQLYNSGDVPARYKWDTAATGPSRDFTIVPAHGFLAPQSDSSVSITFHPAGQKGECRRDKVRCVVEGVQEPLTLSMSGECVARPSPTGAPLTFSAKVRESATAVVTLPRNEGDKAWTLTPVFSHEFFSGPSVVEIPAKGTATYTVTYKPLLQTKEGGPAAPAPFTSLPAGSDPILAHVGLASHAATLFFALPDGTGLSYSLMGKAGAPALAGSVHHSTPAKKTLAFGVHVDNPLRFTQRFAVSWDPAAVPASALLKGGRTHDVPGLSSRDYKMSYTPQVEGRVTLPVTFTAEATGESVVMEVVLEADKAGLTGSLACEATVRQSVSAPIAIANPLAGSGAPIHFAPPVVDHPALRVVRVGSHDGAGTPEIMFRVDFRPLIPTAASGGADDHGHKRATPPPSAGKVKPGHAHGSKPGTAVGGAHPSSTVDNAAAGAPSAKISLHSDQLGDFSYDVSLKAMPAGPEPTLRFAAPLGGRASCLYRFRHFEGKAGSYRIVSSHPDVFTVPPTLSVPLASGSTADAWEGTEAVLEVVFEGLAIGDTAGELTLTSEHSGTHFTVPLAGACTPPRPAGPFDMLAGGQTVIDFRNVFGEDREFVIATDPAGTFSASPMGAVRVPKKSSVPITVKFTPPSGPTGTSAVTGRLLVSCPSLPDLPAWLYYLKGEAQVGQGAKDAAKPGSASGKKR